MGFTYCTNLPSCQGVAELGYEIEKSIISTSYSLRLERLCVKQNHTLNQQRPYQQTKLRRFRLWE